MNRTALAALAFGALLLLPSAASAVAPAPTITVGEDRKHSIAWTNEGALQYIKFAVSDDDGYDSDEGWPYPHDVITKVDPVAVGATSVTLPVELPAGDSWLFGRWRDPASGSLFRGDLLGPLKIVVAGYFTNATQTVVQSPRQAPIVIKGSFTTNYRALTVLCSVMSGRTTVDSFRVRKQDLRPGRISFTCSDRAFGVGEDRDGDRLVSKVVIRDSSNRVVKTLTKAFTAS